MVWTLMLNPPETKKKKGKKKAKSGRRKAVNKRKGKVPSKPKKGGGMAKKRKNPKGYPTTAKGRSYRALVKKHGVQKAAKLWRAKKRKPAAKRKYASNAWKRDKIGHKIASLVGHARSKGVSVPKYLHAAGISQAQISTYISKHGAVGGKKRAYTKARPAPASKRYVANPKGRPTTARGKAYRSLVKKHGVMKAAAMWRKAPASRKPSYARNYMANPTAAAIETVKGVFTVESAKNIVAIGAGFAGMAVGHAVVRKLKADAGAPLVIAGEISGSLAVGAGVAIGTKSVARGLITAGSGIALSLFKMAWAKVAGREILGLTMPGLTGVDDYVELPYAAGMEDYVELPYAAGMGQTGQALYTDMSQFLPPEAAEVGQAYQTGMEQFIPEQFGEYTVGIGEEAEVEY